CTREDDGYYGWYFDVW
nr:immunoglobulin heavy chain junction region [Mus musculus]MBK4184315.1 immunoglobulin heavy chain junction region [Mus musculus]